MWGHPVVGGVDPTQDGTGAAGMRLSTEIRSENPLGRAGTERLPRVCGSSAVPSSTPR